MPGEKTVYKVEDLVAKKQYKFRIRAVNKIGTSEPAMFANAVLAKDPWGEYLRNLKKKYHLMILLNFLY